MRVFAYVARRYNSAAESTSLLSLVASLVKIFSNELQYLVEELLVNYRPVQSLWDKRVDRVTQLNKTCLLLQGTWKNMIGSCTDTGSSWTGSIPYSDAQWHYGPARLWATPVNCDGR